MTDVKHLVDTLLSRFRPLKASGSPLSCVQLSVNDALTPAKKDDGMYFFLYYIQYTSW